MVDNCVSLILLIVVGLDLCSCLEGVLIVVFVCAMVVFVVHVLNVLLFVGEDWFVSMWPESVKMGLWLVMLLFLVLRYLLN